MEMLKQWLDGVIKISDTEWEYINTLFARVAIPKGTHWVRSGQICTQIAFIQQGLFRLYYQTAHQEKTMLFFTENQLVTDYFSFLTQTPSIRLVEALEDSVIYTITFEQLHQLYEYSPQWQKIGRLMAEFAYTYAIQRANRLIHDNADTRYLTMLQEQPALIQRIPQYLIASYLDMTPETLSRVRRRIQQSQTHVEPSIHTTLPLNPFQHRFGS